MKKKTLAKYYVIGVLFLIGNLLLYNCQKEDFFTKTTEAVVTQSKKYNVQKLGSKELQEDTEIGMALQKIRNRFKRNVANQAATERSVVVGDGLIILDDEVAKIEVDNTITWTFKIETPTHEASEIENFMIKKHNNEFTYYLIKYKHSNENSDDPYRATLEKINGNALDTSNINLSSRDAFDWEFGGGGGGDDDCEGIIVNYELQACNQGGTHTAGTFCCQHPEQHGCEYAQNFCGDTCNGTSEVPIRDFSHCDGYGGPTGDPVDGDNPNDGDLSGGSTGGSSGSGDGDNDSTVTTLVDPRCPGDLVTNPATGNCECPEGKEPDPNNSIKCICLSGYTENINGLLTCVEKPCKGNPVKDPVIAPQKGRSGAQGALYGCKRWHPKYSCGGVVGRKKHNALDIKNSIGNPTHAMHDGIIYSTGYDKKDLGYYAIVQSTINGRTFLILYAHLQQNNRVLQGVSGSPLVQIKAGDIIGYQGKSGNLRRALAQKSVDPHVHIEIREHDGSSSWNYKNNFNLVDPRPYLSTTIDNQGVSQPNTNCI